ncbi:MAG: hypothetical protein IKP38_08150 [Clostridia bacterium]|nr:hypothetical protein [Clostridia bacterium]
MYVGKKKMEYYNGLEQKLKHCITADGIRFICETYHWDAEKIGRHFIEVQNVTFPSWKG